MGSASFCFYLILAPSGGAGSLMEQIAPAIAVQP